VWWLYLPGLVVFLGYVAMGLRRTYGTRWPGAVARVFVLGVLTAALFFWIVPRLLIVSEGIF
jgi:hypothetical protein